MIENFPKQNYSSVIFIDSMVVLEGKPLNEQDWSEIDLEGPILVVAVPQVLKEIDKRKRDGRLGKHARAFNRLIMHAATSGDAHTILDNNPRVDIQLAITSKLNWSNLDDLDHDEPDAKVIAQVLHTKYIDTTNAFFLSHDVNPIAMACRHGIKTKKMPDSWLREPEPNPFQKENAKLKGKVRELEANQPIIELKISFDGDTPISVLDIEPFKKEEREYAYRAILQDNPKFPQSRSAFGGMLDYDDEYDGNYNKFKGVIVPKFVHLVHEHLEHAYNQFPIEIKVSNTGSIQAENLEIIIHSEDAKLSEKWFFMPIRPIAPRPNPRGLNLSIPNLSFNNSSFVQHVGRHEMVISEADGKMILRCVDFRHGNSFFINAIATVNTKEAKKITFKSDATAANLRGAVSVTSEIRKSIKQILIKDLVGNKINSFIYNQPANAIFAEIKDEDEISDKINILKFDD